MRILRRDRRRTPRQAARTVVMDQDGSVFLLRSDNSEVGVHWTSPGGGIEPGESPLEGARRELWEETGWTDLAPGPLLCTWEHDFTWHGIPVRQHEHIFLTLGPRRGPVGDVSAVHATDGILGWRWWTAADLADERADALWPPQLPALLTGVRASGWPGAGTPGPLPAVEPVDLGHVADRTGGADAEKSTKSGNSRDNAGA
ncbi:NUDIX domain-containing protein [Kitasatospora sp. NBC_00240]|uniref:NUDIX hydrolase n=1 Tax=Kitasatospora sp. NBC_00240 TaxID=2903567 RepID=UPI00225187D9|nr:NUDIX domain-containing protein [Kitasatospora sp. NBC_00240]MCX5212807.1 NUDIX domain-containing protein [Kitasatospora sp. NBC_00240]